MRLEEIEHLRHRQPFQPFRVTLKDGRSYDVVHPELVMVGETMVAIGLPAPGETEPIYDRVVTVDYDSILQLEPQQPAETA